MTQQNTPVPGVVGWLGAALTSAALLGGAGALALTAQRPQEPLMLDLGQAPPAAPAVAAVADAAPQVVDEAPDQAAPPAPVADAPPPLPDPEARTTPALAPPVTLPKPDVMAQSDLTLPAPEVPKPPAPEPKPAPDPKPEPVAKPEPPKADPKPPTKAARAKASSAAPSAPTAGATAQGGARPTSAAAYAKAVMKMVRATRKKSGVGRGVVVVGFTLSGSGALAGVQVLRGSGNAALDRIAVSHIQRSAPFPAPPEGANRNFSFEFIGK